MIKEEELKYYREHVIGHYIDDVMKQLAVEENKTERLRRRIPKEYLPDYKRCKRCRNVKPLTEFYKNPLKFKGVFDYCKECAKARQKELRDERQRSNRVDTIHRNIA